MAWWILIVNKNNELIWKIWDWELKTDKSVEYVEKKWWIVVKLLNDYQTNDKTKCIVDSNWNLWYKKI